VPNQFEDVEEYVKIFENLLVEEFRAQVEKEKDEVDSSIFGNFISCNVFF
jgi:hypothetical protein